MLTVSTARQKDVAAQLVRLAVVSVPGGRPCRCTLVEAMEVQRRMGRDLERVEVSTVVIVVVRLVWIRNFNIALDELPTRKASDGFCHSETLLHPAPGRIVVVDVALGIRAVIHGASAGVTQVSERANETAARKPIDVCDPRPLVVVVTFVVVGVGRGPHVDQNFSPGVHVVQLKQSFGT